MRTELEKRCLTLSYENGLSHISSVLTSVGLIDHVYNTKADEDIFVLGNSHAALALFVVLEKHGVANAQELIEKHGTHAMRDIENEIWVSGGSLGQAECVAVGLAMADSTRNVYLLTSDGACAEGSIWEALAIARKQRLENLRIQVVANGYSAYGKVDVDDLDARLNSFYPTLVTKVNLFSYPDFLQRTDGHYVVMNEKQYKEAMNG